MLVYVRVSLRGRPLRIVYRVPTNQQKRKKCTVRLHLQQRTLNYGTLMKIQLPRQLATKSDGIGIFIDRDESINIVGTNNRGRFTSVGRVSRLGYSNILILIVENILDSNWPLCAGTTCKSRIFLVYINLFLLI